jgi:glutamate racemase
MTDAPAFSLYDAPAAAPLGVFDSGVGGLSILRAMRGRLPGASMLYLGDVARAPYGDRAPPEVIERSLQVTEWLIAQGAQIVVVACNTATVLAIEALRARWPARTFIGVEPGVKPAVSRSRNRRIAVMATHATAHSARLRHLIARHAEGADVHVQACPGLADTIERGLLDGPELLEVLRPHCDAIRGHGADTVVLGCTHYAFIEPAIRALLGDAVMVVDTATAIAERAASMHERKPGGASEWGGSASLHIVTTGASAPMRRLIERCAGLEGASVESLAL